MTATAADDHAGSRPESRLGRAARPPFRPPHGAAGGHRPALLRDLSADHLGLSGALALRAGAGRLHAEIHRPDQFPEAARPARSSTICSAPSAPLGRSQWIVLALVAAALLFLARAAISDAAGSPCSGIVGRLHRGGAGTGARARRRARHHAPGGVPGTSSTRCSTSSSASPCSSCSASASRCSARQPIRGRNFFRVLFFIPLMVTPVGIAYTFRMLADMQKGPFAPLCAAFGVGEWSWATEAWSARLMVLVGDTWQWTPFMFIVLLAAIENQPRDQVEAAQLDGASALADLPRHHLAGDRAGRGDRRADPADRGLQDHRPAERADRRRPGPRDRIDDAALLHRLAHAGPRRLGGGRLYAALRLDGHLRLLLQLRGPPGAEVRGERAPTTVRCCAGCSSRAASTSRRRPPKVVDLCAALSSGRWSCLVPLYWVLITSFKLPGEVDNGPFYIPFVDFQPSLDAWRLHLRRRTTRCGPYLNSVVVALVEHRARRADRLARGLCAGAHPLPGQARCGRALHPARSSR